MLIRREGQRAKIKEPCFPRYQDLLAYLSEIKKKKVKIYSSGLGQIKIMHAPEVENNNIAILNHLPKFWPHLWE